MDSDLILISHCSRQDYTSNTFVILDFQIYYKSLQDIANWETIMLDQ